MSLTFALALAGKYGLEIEVQKEIDNGLTPEQALYEWDLKQKSVKTEKHKKKLKRSMANPSLRPTRTVTDFPPCLLVGICKWADKHRGQGNRPLIQKKENNINNQY